MRRRAGNATYAIEADVSTLSTFNRRATLRVDFPPPDFADLNLTFAKQTVRIDNPRTMREMFRPTL